MINTQTNNDMKTPEEFYADAGFDTHPDAMTETALVIAMMRQYAEYYHKNLVTDEVSSGVTQWVAVGDRLPKEHGKYIVCIKRNGQTDLDLVTWNTVLKNWDYNYLHPITFWMEKPEPPCG